jgi:hypothetical protein
MVKRGHFGGISETFLLPLRGSSVGGMYVCYKNNKIEAQTYNIPVALTGLLSLMN